jgi:hypothetical protein
MPGVRCAVFGYKNNHKTKKGTGQEGQDIIFHSFPKPKDMVSQTMRNEWINRCKREDKLNPETSRICSKHFVETDYERDLQNELLGKKIIILSLFEPNIKAHLNLYLNNTDFHCT